MAYKDLNKQREASKQAMRRHRAKQGITSEQGTISEGITEQGITDDNVIPEQGTLTPEGLKPQVPAPAKPRPDKHRATASDPDVQAIWDRRNAQGQDCFDGLSVRQLREVK